VLSQKESLRRRFLRRASRRFHSLPAPSAAPHVARAFTENRIRPVSPTPSAAVPIPPPRTELSPVRNAGPAELANGMGGARSSERSGVDYGGIGELSGEMRRRRLALPLASPTLASPVIAGPSQTTAVRKVPTALPEPILVPPALTAVPAPRASPATAPVPAPTPVAVAAPTSASRTDLSPRPRSPGRISQPLARWNPLRSPRFVVQELKFAGPD